MPDCGVHYLWFAFVCFLIRSHPPGANTQACFRPYLHVFHPIWVLAPGGGGGPPKGWVHNLLMQFFTLGSTKIKVFETCFYDIVIT